jgi:hypothetical protein
MYHLPIIQFIAEDRIREMHRIAQDNRDARVARQRSARLREAGAGGAPGAGGATGAAGEARTPVALRLLPARIRPRVA